MPLSKDRIAVVIGKNGEVKKKIEEMTGTSITIDSETGEYNIESVPVNQDTIENEFLNEEGEFRKYQTKFVLDAINHGFNPEKALKLLDPELHLDVVNLEDVLGDNEKRLTRMKGRLIGESGKIRNSIEQFSSVNISILNKTVAVIGDFDSIKIAKKAITMIIQGSPHKTVLNYLQKEYQERKRMEFTSTWKPTL
jgi:ribosomal RNA assembly protein